MLYLVGGTSRSGKSIIANRILKRAGIPFFPLDSMVMGFTNGMPEVGINDKQYMDEIGSRMWPFSKEVCVNIITNVKEYVIEGESMLPQFMAELIEQYPGKIRACCAGYAEADIQQKLSDVKTFNYGESDWLSNNPDPFIIKHISEMVRYSKIVKEECAKYNIKYFDTSSRFSDVVDEAVSYLLGV